MLKLETDDGEAWVDAALIECVRKTGDERCEVHVSVGTCPPIAARMATEELMALLEASEFVEAGELRLRKGAVAIVSASGAAGGSIIGLGSGEVFSSLSPAEVVALLEA